MKIGDKVQWNGTNSIGIIIAINDETVWVEHKLLFSSFGDKTRVGTYEKEDVILIDNIEVGK